MKLTKQQVAEARKIYERMIEVFFFFRPLENLNEIVHEHFLGYGTAAHEFFKNHEQLVGMARMQADHGESKMESEVGEFTRLVTSLPKA